MVPGGPDHSERGCRPQGPRPMDPMDENLGLDVRSGMPLGKKWENSKRKKLKICWVGALWSVLGSILQPEVTQPSVAGTEPRDLSRYFSNSAAIGGAEQGGDSGADPW